MCAINCEIAHSFLARSNPLSNVLIHQYLVLVGKLWVIHSGVDHNTITVPVYVPHIVFCFVFVSVISINHPPLFAEQEQTKAAENSSNNKHEKKEENNTASKVIEVSFVLQFKKKKKKNVWKLLFKKVQMSQNKWLIEEHLCRPLQVKRF